MSQEKIINVVVISIVALVLLMLPLNTLLALDETSNEPKATKQTDLNIIQTWNLPPTITPISQQSVEVGNLLTFTVLAKDPEQDTLTYSLESTAPSGTAIDRITGEFTWIPETTGTYDFSILVSDRINLAVTASLRVTVTAPNLPPTVTPITDRTVEVLNLLTFTVLAKDPEQDTLTYSLGETAPVGSEIDSTTGTFTWTPSTTGITAFDILVSDGVNPAVHAPITVTVTAYAVVIDITAPLITINGENTISVSQNTTYVDEGALAIDDFDGDISKNIIVENNTSTIADGSYSLIYTATDSSGNIATAIRNINIIEELELSNLRK